MKRLETNKIRGGFKDPEKTLLLPVSFGVSSVTLLHVLDQQLRNRAQQERHAGYKLHVIFVNELSVSDQPMLHTNMSLLQLRYPSHTYTTILLEDCISYGINVGGSTNGKEHDYRDVMSDLSSATSKADFIEITRRRLILAFAKKHKCDSILFGDSTTRLAEKTLSATAKGRGIALPWLTADGPSNDGITCIYPMRDLLRKELKVYADTLSPPLTAWTVEPPVQAPTSSKDTTIDALMSQYFESVEQNHPSIVANVVRTSDRLVAPSVPEQNSPCSLCEHPILNDLWGGEQQSATLSQSNETMESSNDQAFCYGCARTVMRR